MRSSKFYAIVLVLLVAVCLPIAAKKKKEPIQLSQNTAPVTKDLTIVTEECRENLSLFTENAKVKNYADALDTWKSVYTECPTASRNIYILGVNIIKWQIEQSATEEERNAHIQELMKLYDDWMRWFNDEKSPKGNTLFKKADAYLEYYPNDKLTPYNWSKGVIEEMGEKTDAYIIHKFFVQSFNLYVEDTTLRAQFINDYTLISNILDAHKDDQTYIDTKAQMDVLFANSGAAECEMMNEIFLSAIEANKDNADYLASKMRLFRRVDCTEEEAYFAAATYQNAISPSAESAAGLGSMNMKKGEYQEAIKYFQQAISLSDNDEDAANYLLSIASTYFKMKQYSQARSYCKQSIEKNAQAQAYIMLGLIYASGPSVSEDPVLARTKYWAAVDQFIKARNAAGENQKAAQTASTYISTYSKHFPEKTDVFMHPDLKEGSSYFVGSWISESTTVRCR